VLLVLLPLLLLLLLLLLQLWLQLLLQTWWTRAVRYCFFLHLLFYSLLCYELLCTCVHVFVCCVRVFVRVYACVQVSVCAYMYEFV